MNDPPPGSEGAGRESDADANCVTEHQHADARLNAVRDRIDELDRRILALANERAERARDIAEIKRRASEVMHVARPEREARLLRELATANPGPLDDAAITRIFREVISACRALEQPLQVAYLGPEGTFTQAAAYKHFGRSVGTRPLGAIDEIFREVAADSVHFGVVPVENSTEGMVSHTLDLFMQSSLRICGEILLRVHHQVIGRPDSLADVATVYAHQQSLAQCREWLDANLSGARWVAVSSNGEAARLAANEPRTVAIASEMAAEVYDLAILAERIEDEPDNTTRFLVIGDHDVPPSGDDKTSLMLSARNRPGALFHLIAPLAEHRIDMTRLESRPTRGRLWEYVFFIDILGHVDSDTLRPVLDALRDEAALCRILGAYPRAVD